MDFFYDNYILFWVCILGLCFGSFYNVVILRTLTNESIVFPASKCPKCGKDAADTYSRIVGFLVPFSAYSKERKQEFEQRKWFDFIHHFPSILWLRRIY